MRTQRAVLAAIVLIHLIVSFVHGAAHTGARVFLPLAGNLFVYIVILAGPGTWSIDAQLASLRVR